MRTAVTLIELTVVVIIIGILAAIVIPMFPRAMERTRADEAVASLQQIRTAERVYRVEENSYWPSSGAGGPTEIEGINDTLRLYLDMRDERNWNYSIGVATTVAFTATATRYDAGGRNDGETITIDETGDIDTSNWTP